MDKRGQGGIEPPTSRTRSENHATRPLTRIAMPAKGILDPGIEPGTYCVLGSRHNQLDQPSTKASSEGLEPSISRFVVSRLIQLGHEDFAYNGQTEASMAEWSKALDLSSSIRKNAWVRTPLEASPFGSERFQLQKSSDVCQIRTDAGRAQ